MFGKEFILMGINSVWLPLICVWVGVMIATEVFILG